MRSRKGREFLTVKVAMTLPVKKLDPEGYPAKYTCGEDPDGGNVFAFIDSSNPKGYDTDLCECYQHPEDFVCFSHFFNFF